MHKSNYCSMCVLCDNCILIVLHTEAFIYDVKFNYMFCSLQDFRITVEILKLLLV